MTTLAKRKLNETLGLLAQKEIDIKEGLKVKAYEISVVKEKHDKLVKQSLLTNSHYEGLVKEKTKVITDLKLKEEKDIDKMLSKENQLQFLNEIVQKESINSQTISIWRYYERSLITILSLGFNSDDAIRRYTWTLFLRSKDETPEVLKYFLTMIQRNLQALVISVRTDRGTEFLNKTLNAFFKEEGIEHQTSTPRTPKQNGVVERLNRTLVEAARMMLSASKLPLFFWAEAILKGYRVYNKRTRLIVESIHLRFDEIKEMSKTFVANDTSGLVPQRQKASDYDNPNPAPELQNVSPSADTTVPSQQELDLLFGPLYDEFFNDGTSRVNKSSSPTENSIQKDTLPSTHIQPTSELTTLTHVHAEENNNNQVEFTNPFCTPIQEHAESSSCNIGNSNVHTFNQPQDSEYRWTKDHPLTQVHGDPSRPVQTR
ncbi:retrovirus-related pol polyprotein from transposon TNT 1-94 [Tanacetum coccineum]